MAYAICGLKLHAGKEELVKARLSKRIRALDLDGFDEYLAYVEGDRSGQEQTMMIDALTTNKTSFFREPQHFDYLRRQILPGLRSAAKIRLWSAGCSSGEEPYTLAILVREELPDIARRDVRILATDISTRMLGIAREAVYEQDKLEDIAPQLVQRNFTCVSTGSPRSYQVKPEVRKLVQCAQLNLIGNWPMRGPFDAIFCRNVMIYFDKPTQERLVHRYWELLRPGGHLFVGHSESLSNTSREFRYVQPAVYVK